MSTETMLQRMAASYCEGTWRGEDVEDWEVADVTDFSFVFANQPTCNPDVSHWNVASATTMEGMFLNAAAFNGDVNKWDVAKVTSFKNMFRGAKLFQSANTYKWDVVINSTKFVDLEDMMLGTNFSTRAPGWPVWTPEYVEWNYTVVTPVVDLGLKPLEAVGNPATQPARLSASPQYGWVATDESPCYSESGAVSGCFYGVKTSHSLCFDYESGSFVADAECEAIFRKPNPISTACSVVDQCYREYGNQWSACDNKCGLGYRFKKGVCTSLVTGAVAPSDLCEDLPTPYLVDPIQCEGREDCTGRYWKETPGAPYVSGRYLLSPPVLWGEDDPYFTDRHTCQKVDDKCFMREKSVCKYQEPNGEIRTVERSTFSNGYSYQSNAEWYENCKDIAAPSMLTWFELESDFGNHVDLWNACCTKLGFRSRFSNVRGGR